MLVLTRGWTLVTALDAALIAHYIQCWHVMTHYLTAITGRGQTRGLTRHSALGNYVVTGNGAWNIMMYANIDASGSFWSCLEAYSVKALPLKLLLVIDSHFITHAIICLQVWIDFVHLLISFGMTLPWDVGWPRVRVSSWCSTGSN